MAGTTIKNERIIKAVREKVRKRFPIWVNFLLMALSAVIAILMTIVANRIM